MSIDASNSKAKEAADNARQAVQTYLDGIPGLNVFASQISAFVGAFIWTLGVVPSILFGSIFTVAGDITAAFLDGITEVRDNNRDALNTVIASALTEVLGIPISSGDLPTGSGSGANVASFRAIGSKVLSAITDELGGTASGSPGPGEQGASTFLGFGLAFAVNGGLLGIISELASMGFIKGFEELAQEVQQSLGLGRLMRQAIQPLIHTLVALPYTRELNRKYRPHQLSAQEYVTAFHAGRMDEATMRDNLAQLGFSDAYITEIVAQRFPRLSAHEVDALVRWGKLPLERATEVLVAQGWPEGHVNLVLDSLHLAQADAQEHAYAGEVLKLAQQRFIAPEVYSSLITRLHMSQEEQQGFLNRLGIYLDSNTKRLTISEVLYLAEHHLLTQGDIDKWATDEGYNDDTHALLDLWLTQKEVDFDALQKAKAARKTGKKPPAHS